MIYIGLIDHQTEEELLKYSSTVDVIPTIGSFIEYENKQHYKVIAVTHIVKDRLVRQVSLYPAPHCNQIILHVKKL
jgi:hypothetical protein